VSTVLTERPAPARTTPPAGERPSRVPRVLAYVVLVGTSLGVLAPFLWTLYTSFRPFADTAKRGYVSLPGTLSLENYSKAWTQTDMPQYFVNTLVIVVPAVLVVLTLASFLAYVLARFSFRFNLALLVLFTAGNLLPPQVIITPLYRLYLMLPLPGSESGLFYDSYVGIIAIHVAFQLGFCTFVMSNYMRTIPRELTEAALVDGASVLRQFFQVVLPLCRAPLAALATLEFTWIYNDFFWALVLMPSGDKRPITSALNNLQGIYFTNDNLIAAGSVLAALPTILVYVLLQRQFVHGLTMGTNK
jgi:multiple sugar transport system permease protein